jgi:two-component system cell cycle sensor histidine kinase/response regulator CckA
MTNPSTRARRARLFSRIVVVALGAVILWDIWAGVVAESLGIDIPYRVALNLLFAIVIGIVVVSIRISEGRRRQRHLSEEQFRATFEQAPIGVCHATPEGKYLDVNKRFASMVGYTREELLGRHFNEVSHPDDADAALTHVRALVSRQATVVSYDRRYIHKNGSVVFVHVTVSGVFVENGRVEYLIAMVEDITARRRADARVTFQARLLDSVHEAVIATDAEGRVIYWNRFAEELYGWTAEETHGKLIIDLTQSPRMREQAGEVLARLAGGKPWSGELEVTDRHGGVFQAMVTEAPIFDDEGRLVGIVGISRDVTAEKEAAERLRNRDAQFTVAQQIATLGSWEYDYRTGARLWSEQTFRLHGLEPGEPSPALIHPLIIPEDQPKLMRLVREVESWTPLIEAEYRIRRADDGRERVIETRGRLVYGDDGRPSKMLAVVNDVTERRAAEKEMERNATQQATIANLAHIALSRAGTDLLLSVASNVVAELLGVNVCTILELQGDKAQLAAGYGFPSHLVGTARLAAGPGSQADFVRKSQEVVLIPDLSTETRFQPSPHLLLHHVVSGAAFPITSGEGKWGILGAYSRNPRTFSQSEIHFLRAVASVLGQGIDRRRAEEELMLRAAQQTAVAEIGTRALAELDDSTMDHACLLIKATVGADYARFLEYSPESGDLGVRAGDGFDSNRVPASEETQAGYALLTNQAVVVSDYRTDRRFPITLKLMPQQIGAGVCVPVRGRTTTFGVLSILSTQPRPFTDADVQFFKAMANVLAEAMERQAANHRLVVSESRYREVVEGASDIIFSLAPDGTVLSLNRAFEVVSGWKCSDWVGRSFAELIPEADRSRLFSLLSDLNEKGEIPPFAATMRTADGGEVYLESTALAKIKDGAILEIFGFARDVTAQRRMEEERARMRTQLEQAKRLTSLGRLAATVAHEFNNVLMGISPFVDLLKREITTPRAVMALEHVASSIRRGKNVTGEVLRFARAEEPLLQPFAVEPMVQRLVDEMGKVVGPFHPIESVCEPDLPELMGDAGQLQQILTNLILNARDAMPEGGTIDVRAMRGRADGTYPFGVIPEGASFVHLSVGDHGSGMAPEVLQHIFEPLFTTKKNGTGLGLAVTHQVVSRHGGYVFVDSRVGEGSTFHIFLPVAAGKPLEVREERVAASSQRRRFRSVLLVEDEPAVSAGLATLLEHDGARVASVGTAAEVLPAIERERPDIVVLDIGLPDADGVHVYLEIDKRYPDLPVVFSTGHGDRAKLESHLAKPHVGFILKPYDVEALYSAFERIA